MGKKKIDGSKIEEIINWSNKGLKAADIARIESVSYDTAKKYINIIYKIRNRQNYCINTHTINEEAISEYCKKVGLEKTVNTYGKEESGNATEQLQFLNAESSADEVRAKVIDAVNMLLNFLLEAKG